MIDLPLAYKALVLNRIKPRAGGGRSELRPGELRACVDVRILRLKRG